MCLLGDILLIEFISLAGPTDFSDMVMTLREATQEVKVVPPAGIEPALPCENGILNPARLPIPPEGHFR